MALTDLLVQAIDEKIPFRGLLIRWYNNPGLSVQILAAHAGLVLSAQIPGVLLAAPGIEAELLARFCTVACAMAIQIAERLNLSSCDGVPWDIHKIEDDEARATALAAWEQSHVG